MLSNPVLWILLAAVVITWTGVLWPVIRDQTSWGFRLWWSWHRRFHRRRP